MLRCDWARIGGDEQANSGQLESRMWCTERLTSTPSLPPSITLPDPATMDPPPLPVDHAFTEPRAFAAIRPDPSAGLSATADSPDEAALPVVITDKEVDGYKEEHVRPSLLLLLPGDRQRERALTSYPTLSALSTHRERLPSDEEVSPARYEGDERRQGVRARMHVRVHQLHHV